MLPLISLLLHLCSLPGLELRSTPLTRSQFRVRSSSLPSPGLPWGSRKHSSLKVPAQCPILPFLLEPARISDILTLSLVQLLSVTRDLRAAGPKVSSQQYLTQRITLSALKHSSQTPCSPGFLPWCSFSSSALSSPPSSYHWVSRALCLNFSLHPLFLQDFI